MSSKPVTYAIVPRNLVPWLSVSFVTTHTIEPQGASDVIGKLAVKDSDACCDSPPIANDLVFDVVPFERILCMDSGCCTPALHQCNGALLEVCDQSGQWTTKQVCPQGCDSYWNECGSVEANEWTQPVLVRAEGPKKAQLQLEQDTFEVVCSGVDGGHPCPDVPSIGVKNVGDADACISLSCVASSAGQCIAFAGEDGRPNFQIASGKETQIDMLVIEPSSTAIRHGTLRLDTACDSKTVNVTIRR